jgi:hypothetical protein
MAQTAVQEETVMTDYQFKAILELIENILESKSKEEALAEIRRIRRGENREEKEPEK